MTRARDVSNIDGILTTKGDIYAATAAATPARLAVGTNGQALLADSTTATGLRWGAAGTTPSFTLLGTGTTTSGSTVTVSGISGINQILIYFNAVRCDSGPAEFRLRLNGDTSPTTHIGSNIRFNVGNSNNGTDISSTTFFRLGTTSVGTDALGGGVMLYGCNSTNTKVASISSGPSYTGSTGGISYVGTGYYIGSSTISSVSVITNAGSFNGGSFLVYGSA